MTIHSSPVRCAERWTKRLVALALACPLAGLSLAGCGADDAGPLLEGTPATMPDGRDESGPVTTDDVQGVMPQQRTDDFVPGPSLGLTGRIFINSTSEDYEIDLATRIARALPGAGVDDTLHDVRPDGSERLYQSFRDPTYDYEISVRDPRGARRAVYQPFEEHFSQLRISPDGRFIGTKGNFTNPVLVVFARDGSLVRRIADEISSFAFMPDSHRVIFTSGESIFIHDLTTNVTSGVVGYRGETPTDISPSPDGRRIAVTLGDFDILQNHIWLFDLLPNGTAGRIRQVTTSGLNEDLPTWSPDGTQLLVRHGIVYTSAIVVGRGCPELYLVPADAAEPTRVGITGTAPGLFVKYPDGLTRNCVQARPIWLAP